MDKLFVVAMLCAGLLAVPMAYVYAVEFYDPLPDVPGKFMGPHGPQHLDWHYHGPPANEPDHCEAALADGGAPEGVHHHCGGNHD